MFESWIIFKIFLIGTFSFSSSCLHSSVHPPPAAVACEAVHLSTTVHVAQAGIASSFLEAESVSLLWWFITWSQHRKNMLFFQSQHCVGCLHVTYVLHHGQFKCLSRRLLSCLNPDSVVCQREPSLTSRLSCIPCVGHRLSAIPVAWVPDNECLCCTWLHK